MKDEPLFKKKSPLREEPILFDWKSLFTEGPEKRARKIYTSRKGVKKLPDAAKPFQWKKGQSGNLKGRPRKAPEPPGVFSDLETLGVFKNQTPAEDAAEALIIRALQGDMKAMKQIFRIREGKLK